MPCDPDSRPQHPHSVHRRVRSVRGAATRDRGRSPAGEHRLLQLPALPERRLRADDDQRARQDFITHSDRLLTFMANGNPCTTDDRFTRFVSPKHPSLINQPQEEAT